MGANRRLLHNFLLFSHLIALSAVVLYFLRNRLLFLHPFAFARSPTHLAVQPSLRSISFHSSVSSVPLSVVIFSFPLPLLFSSLNLELVSFCRLVVKQTKE
jgi:hypothetical protein